MGGQENLLALEPSKAASSVETRNAISLETTQISSNVGPLMSLWLLAELKHEIQFRSKQVTFPQTMLPSCTPQKALKNVYRPEDSSIQFQKCKPLLLRKFAPRCRKSARHGVTENIFLFSPKRVMFSFKRPNWRFIKRRFPSKIALKNCGSFSICACHPCFKECALRREKKVLMEARRGSRRRRAAVFGPWSPVRAARDDGAVLGPSRYLPDRVVTSRLADTHLQKRVCPCPSPIEGPLKLTKTGG